MLDFGNADWKRKEIRSLIGGRRRALGCNTHEVTIDYVTFFTVVSYPHRESIWLIYAPRLPKSPNVSID